MTGADRRDLRLKAARLRIEALRLRGLGHLETAERVERAADALAGGGDAMTEFGPVSLERTNTGRIRLVERVRDPGKWEAERTLLTLSPAQAVQLATALQDMAENADPRLRPRSEGVFAASELYR